MLGTSEVQTSHFRLTIDLETRVPENKQLRITAIDAEVWAHSVSVRVSRADLAAERWSGTVSVHQISGHSVQL